MATFDDYLYVEETDRSSGIKVVPETMPAGLAVGDIIDVGETLQTAQGKRQVAGTVLNVH